MGAVQTENGTIVMDTTTKGCYFSLSMAFFLGFAMVLLLSLFLFLCFINRMCCFPRVCCVHKTTIISGAAYEQEKLIGGGNLVSLESLGKYKPQYTALP